MKKTEKLSEQVKHIASKNHSLSLHLSALTYTTANTQEAQSKVEDVNLEDHPTQLKVGFR